MQNSKLFSFLSTVKNQDIPVYFYVLSQLIDILEYFAAMLS